MHQGVRFTYAEFHAECDEVARGLLALGVEPGDRVGIWSPNRRVGVAQYATAKIGAILVNVNPAYRATELEYALNQSGVRPCSSPPASASRLPGCSTRWPATCPPSGGGRPGAGGAGRGDGWDELRRAAGRVPERAALSARPCSSSTTRSTSSTPPARPASPRARRSRTTTSSTTASSSASGCGYTERDRVCIPVPFYHCFGMVLGNLACTTHGAAMVIPAEAFDPLRDPGGGRRPSAARSLYGVPTMFIAELDHPRFAEFDLSYAAHRDHGRLALPDRGDEAGADRHAHGRGDHLLRHDRDLARSRPRRAPTTRSRSASPPSAASTRTSRSRSSTPSTGADRAARQRGRAAARAATA